MVAVGVGRQLSCRQVSYTRKLEYQSLSIREPQRRVFELHTSILSQLCQKWPYLKITHSSSALFKSVTDLNAVEVWGSNTQPGCPWMPKHT